MTTSVSSLRTKFFEYLFGDSTGLTCIAYAPPSKRDFKQAFFEWPRQKNNLEAFVDQVSHGNNVWFCTSLLAESQRIKSNALPGSLVWADLDAREPEGIEPPPSCVVSSSPGHYHVYWRMDTTVVPEAQEEYSRKLAYKFGADNSGWDITQLLRVPYTYNYKPEYGEVHPMVEILRANDELVPMRIFDEMYVPDETYQKEILTELPMPNALDLPKPEQVLYRYVSRLGPDFHDLYDTEPERSVDWSKKIWRLINLCLEAGMEIEEAFVVAMAAKCNKYERDNRPLSHLWRDVLKADERQRKLAVIINDQAFTLKMPELVENKEVRNTFVTEYKDWAVKCTDAPEVYHELGAVILLSSILSPYLKLDTTWGELSPNLWGMVLGGSTLTRKSTAMGMVKKIILELDSDLILASESSPEGLLTGLSLRPNRVSVFFRDEIAGFFESIRDKLYLHSLPEVLTELYDVPDKLPRLLRKDTYTVVKPYFIFFGGGIKDKVFSLIEEQHITSGFIPRFLVVSGDTNAKDRRRTGPPVAGTYEQRSTIVASLADLQERFNVTADVQTPVGTQTITSQITAQLTPEAWKLFSDYELKLELEAENSIVPSVALPTFTRLGFSLLKIATLFAAYRTEPKDNNTLDVEERDVIEAAECIQKWGQHTVELLLNSGKGDIERKSDRAMDMIKGTPGISQTDIFRRYHFRSKEGREILATLSDQGLIYGVKEGRALRWYPTVEGA